jgi:hypothetical protein
VISWKVLGIAFVFLSLIAVIAISTRGAQKMERVKIEGSTDVMGIPPIDAEAPAETATATFGLG